MAAFHLREVAVTWGDGLVYKEEKNHFELRVDPAGIYTK